MVTKEEVRVLEDTAAADYATLLLSVDEYGPELDYLLQGGMTELHLKWDSPEAPEEVFNYQRIVEQALIMALGEMGYAVTKKE